MGPIRLVEREDGLWLRHENIGWMWTQDRNATLYLYNYLNGHWIYLDLTAKTDKRFYDFSLGTWKLLSEQNLEVPVHGLHKNLLAYPLQQC